jgi:hypothetical protein
VPPQRGTIQRLGTKAPGRVHETIDLSPVSCSYCCGDLQTEFGNRSVECRFCGESAMTGHLIALRLSRPAPRSHLRLLAVSSG